MIFIDEMKNMKIYKKQFFLPYNDKDKKHGSLVYLLSPNYASSRNLINSPMTINRRYFESYYFERNAAYYIKTGKVPQEELLEAVIDEQRDSAIHNGFDYEAFDEFLVSKEDPGETPTYYETIKACLLSNKLEDGDYNVYVHPVNHPEIATYIGKINVSVTSDAFYDAFYKWTAWEDIEDEGEYIEEGIDESYFVNEKDIYYNKDKFDSGEINLCFITGHSGAGKSTMARDMSSKKVEIYELDDLVWNKMKFSLENMKEYGNLFYSYFTGRGSKFWYTDEDVKNGTVKAIDKYEEVLINDFIDYAKSYAKAHKDTKFVIEGIWFVDFCKPEDFKDYAFYIKGTSVLVSRWRAAKRDSQDAGDIFAQFRARVQNFTNLKLWKPNWDFEKDLKKFREYFINLQKGAIREDYVEAPSKVYFSKDLTGEKVLEIYQALGCNLTGNVAIKLHSGEPGNQNYIQPDFWKPIIDYVDGTVVECNTAYNGERNTTEKHMKVIADHGWNKYFKFDLMDAEGPDLELPIENGHVLEKNLVGKNLANYNSMIVLSHFKGHPMGGYGGALKNISIGIASSAGKKEIHRVPQDKMVGEYDDFVQEEFLAAMADAASSIIKYFNGNMVFVNVMKNLSIDCDCVADAHDPCMEDIGVLVSTDPVALDQACLDLVYKSNDSGKAELIQRIEEKKGFLTPKFAEELGVGTRSYKLIDLDNSVLEQTDPLDNDYTYTIENRYNVQARDRSDNACVKVKGFAKPMRGRSSIAILKEVDGKLCVFCGIIDKDGSFSKAGDITLPGGGWNPDETPRDAAIREAGEETLMAVKDVMHCGCHIEYSDDKEKVANWVKEHVPEDNWWYGYYSEVFVGIYDQPYKADIAPEDLDDIAEKGKWIPIEDLEGKEPKDYLDAIKKYLKMNTYNPLVESLLEISKMDEEKNEKLEPVFVINSYTGSPFGKVIKSVTKNEFSHTLISFTPSLRKMYSFDFGKKVIDDDLEKRNVKGFLIDNIDRYRAMNTQNIEVFVLMVPMKVKLALEKSVDWYKANIDKTSYGFSNLFDYLRGSKKLDSFGELKMFCSEFVDLILKSQNIDISGKTSRNAAPKDMGHYTDANNFYLIYKGRAIDYSEDNAIAEIEELKKTIPYKKLNAVSKKYIREDTDTGATGSVDATDVQRQMKNLLRKLKMKSKRGIYKFNKDRRKADAQLPTASSIIASVNTGTPSTAPAHSEPQQESFIRALVSATEYEDINSFYMNEDTLMIFNEGEKRFDSPLRKLIWNDRLKANKEVLQIYNKVKADIPSIKYTFIQADRYQARNLWYDLSFYTEIFFKNNTFKMDRAVDLYFDFLSRMLEPSRMPTGYTKRTIFIPVIDWNTNVSKKTWLYRDGINPISVMHRMMSKNMAKVKSVFKNMDIIFFGNGNYFKLNFSTLTPEEEKQLLNRFKIFINKMTSGATFTDDEVDPTPDNQESEKVIVTNVVDKIEKAQKINMNTQSGYIPSAIVTAKAFTGSPVRPTVTNTSVRKAADPLTQKEVKEKIKADEKQAEKIMKANTTSNAVTTTAKKQKVEDIKADEEDKKAIIDRISMAAAKSVNTDDAIDHMEDDEAVKELIMKLAAEEDAGIKINKARMDRMAQLNAEFQEKEVRKGVKIKDILDPEYQKKAADEPLPSTTIKVDSPFADDWKDLKYINFDKTYDINEDIMKMLNALSTKQYPISIRDVKIENTSTSEDYIDTYTIDMEDFRGKRFSIKMDVPKFKDHKYLILRGNKKTIQNQYFNMPILKTDIDTVQIISNYNKIFVRRFGNTRGKTISYADRIIKALSKYEGNTIKIVPGDNSKIGNAFDMPIDYIDLGSIYNTLEVKGDGVYTIYFNQNTIREKYADLIDTSEGMPYAVYKKGNDIRILYYKQSDYSAVPFSAKLYSEVLSQAAGFPDIYEAVNPAKKFVYSQASILNQRIPLIIVCALSEGLLPVLNKAGIHYELVQKLTRDDRHNVYKDYISFSDGYLLYEVTYDSSMLLNGLKEIDTLTYSIDDVNTRRMWIETLDNYGGRIISDGIDNFYECMLDPITIEVLQHYKLPTDYVQLLLYSNALLCDNSYISHGDSSSRRLRKNELLAVKVYKALFNDAYAAYANGLRHNRNNTTFSIKRSAVIDKFMSDTISSDLSIGNCLNDIETINSVTTKGDSGMNSARSYTLDKRVYDSSMVNILGMSTGFAGTVGVTRQATINANIEGKRGYTKSIEGDTKQMSTPNTLTMTEALNPMGSTRDDPVRVAMTFVQTAKHQVRTKKSDPLLITNGADAVLPYVVSDIFCKKANRAGKVVEVEPDKYMVVTYDDGENEYIDLSPRIEKNSDGGFFISVNMITDLKVGQKIKENQILAYDPNSFTKGAGESDKLVYDVGKLAKVAIINSDDNFEDSAMVTSKLADDLSTDVIVKEERILDANTNIYNWLKVGTSVQQEDILYETQTAYEEEDVNQLLKSLAGDEEVISKLGRRPVKSPVTGRIVGIKVYRTCELEEMSENMRKFFKENEANSRAVIKKLESLGINDPTLTGSVAKLEPIGKLKNCDNCVLIEYYLEYHDIMSLGDKLSIFSANKGVVHIIIPSEDAPYTDYRPNEEISLFTGISSINKRQIASNVIIGSLNKLVVELGRSVRDILGISEIDNEIDI